MSVCMRVCFSVRLLILVNASTCFDVCVSSMHDCFVSVSVYYGVCVVLCGVGGGVLTVALMWIRGTMLQ